MPHASVQVMPKGSGTLVTPEFPDFSRVPAGKVPEVPEAWEAALGMKSVRMLGEARYRARLPPRPLLPAGNGPGMGRPCTLRFCSTYACTLLVLWQCFQIS